MDVDRKAAVLLTETELTEKPFRYEEVQRARGGIGDEKAGGDTRGGENDRNGEGDNKRDGDRGKEGERGGGGGSSKRKSGRDNGRGGPDDVRDKKRSRGSKDDSHYEAAPHVVSAWLRTGIRVRVVSRKASTSSKHYLQKAHVLDVHQGSSCSSQRMATLRMEVDGVVIENVKEKYLETVLPGVGEVCMILSGAEKGQLAKLLEKRKDKDSAVVQLVDDLSEILTLPMDSIAAIVR